MKHSIFISFRTGIFLKAYVKYISIGNEVIQIKKIIVYIAFILVIAPIALLPLYYKWLWRFIIGGKPAEASSVDILAFWGAVFGAIITLVGVFLTIRFSERSLENSLYQQEKDNFINSFPIRLKAINEVNASIQKVGYKLAGVHSAKGKEDLTESSLLIVNFFDSLYDIEQSASLDGFVYYKVKEMIDDLTGPGSNETYGLVENFQQQKTNILNVSRRLIRLNSDLKSYKRKIEDRFISFSREEGYGFENEEGFNIMNKMFFYLKKFFY